MSIASISPIKDPRQLEGFRTGEPEIDTWFQEQGYKTHQEGRMTVWIAQDDNGQTVGAFSLKAVTLTQVPESNAKARRYFTGKDVGILIGQLGVREDLHGQGLGKILLMTAIKKCVECSRIAATRAVVLDTLNPGLIKFYQEASFKLLGQGSKRMYMPMSGASKLF